MQPDLILVVADVGDVPGVVVALLDRFLQGGDRLTEGRSQPLANVPRLQATTVWVGRVVGVVIPVESQGGDVGGSEAGANRYTSITTVDLDRRREVRGDAECIRADVAEDDDFGKAVGIDGAYVASADLNRVSLDGDFAANFGDVDGVIGGPALNVENVGQYVSLEVVRRQLALFQRFDHGPVRGPLFTQIGR